MALKVLVNTAWQQAAALFVTDLADAATSDSAQLANVVGGPLHLAWAQTGTSDRRIVYVNKSGGITVDYLVMVNAAPYLGHGVDVRSWATYTGASTAISSSATFAGTLIGEKTKDYVLSLGAQSNKQAVGVDLYAGTGGNYAKTVNKIFFGQAFSLTYPNEIVQQAAWGVTTIKRQAYHFSEALSIKLEPLTKAEWSSLQGLYRIKEEPFFLYDPEATRLLDGLWYCVTQSLNAEPLGNDYYRVNWTVLRLRYWAA